jgi:hypothetical protein
VEITELVSVIAATGLNEKGQTSKAKTMDGKSFAAVAKGLQILCLLGIPPTLENGLLGVGGKALPPSLVIL